MEMKSSRSTLDFEVLWGKHDPSYVTQGKGSPISSRVRLASQSAFHSAFFLSYSWPVLDRGNSQGHGPGCPV